MSGEKYPSSEGWSRAEFVVPLNCEVETAKRAAFRRPELYEIAVITVSGCRAAIVYRRLPRPTRATMGLRLERGGA